MVSPVFSLCVNGTCTTADLCEPLEPFEDSGKENQCPTRPVASKANNAAALWTLRRESEQLKRKLAQEEKLRTLAEAKATESRTAKRAATLQLQAQSQQIAELQATLQDLQLCRGEAQQRTFHATLQKDLQQAWEHLKERGQVSGESGDSEVWHCGSNDTSQTEEVVERLPGRKRPQQLQLVELGLADMEGEPAEDTESVWDVSESEDEEGTVHCRSEVEGEPAMTMPARQFDSAEATSPALVELPLQRELALAGDNVSVRQTLDELERQWEMEFERAQPIEHSPAVTADASSFRRTLDELERQLEAEINHLFNQEGQPTNSRRMLQELD